MIILFLRFADSMQSCSGFHKWMVIFFLKITG